MPRYARLHAPGVLVHVIARFVNRSFRLGGEPERAAYLERLARALAGCDWRIIAYALMSNHVHLCALAGADPPRRLIQPLHGGFATWLNRRDGTLGPVFADRATTVLVPPDRAGQLLAYVHNNPVRAGVVVEAAASRWTSHRGYLGLEAAPGWLDRAAGLELSGLGGPSRLDEWVRARAGEPRSAELSGGEGASVRAGVRRQVGAPAEVSSPWLTPAGAGRLVVGAEDTPRRPRWEGSPLEVLRQVARHTGIGVERMRSRERTRSVSRSRRVALMLWERLGRPAVEMSAVLGIGSGAATQLLRRDPEVLRGAAAAVADLAGACWSGGVPGLGAGRLDEN